MNAAGRAKSAKSRATIAIRMLVTQKSLGRAFDSCFEMWDGDEVVKNIRERANSEQAVREAVILHGYGYWLEPGYLEVTP